MAYKRVEVPAAELERQREICAKIREGLGGARPLAFVDTYGCQQNEADSEALRGYIELMGFGFTEDENEAELIVVNTCAVRGHAEMRVLGNVGALVHAKARNPRLIVAVCGCMVQQPHMAEKIKNSFRVVDLCFGPHELWRFPELYERAARRRGRVFEVSPCEGVVAEGLPVHRQGSVKAWLSVMYGCNNFCTYCIVPYVRGREKSRTIESVVSEVEQLVSGGVREVTLLGQNVNSYGRNIYGEPRFAELLRRVADTGVERIRFTSSNPKDLSDATIAAMAETPAVMPHLHLAVQSGSTRVLRAMNRSYTREEYLELVGRLRAAMPGLALSTDIIVGFPGETEEDFQDTLSLVREASFSSAYTFIYSRRPGTPAAEMADDTPREVIQERFDRLAALVADQAHEANQAFLGGLVSVLVEGVSKRDAGVLVGHSEHNQTVHFALPDGRSSEGLVGSIVDVRVDEARTWYLRGAVEGEPR